MKDNKGYSLIELLGALIIFGLILLVVIPAVSRLLTNNEVKEYNNYLKIIETGAKTYANKMYDDLGDSGDNGCIEVTLDELIREKYIKKFNDKTITCSGKVRINNEKGNLKTSIDMKCGNNEGTTTFEHKKIGSESCIEFIPREEGGLTNTVLKNGFGSSGSTTKYDNKQFVRGINPNNYVWYSGKLWRIVWYTEDAVKLISTDIVTVLNRDNNDIKYSNSVVDKWLQNIFLPSLKDYNDYLIDTTWDVSPTSAAAFSPGKTEVVTRKVGLLNSYEVSKMGSFITGDYNWLLSNYYSNKIRFATKSGSGFTTEESFENNKYYAIRPAITMKSDVFVLSGNGTKDAPYILEGNSNNIPKGTLLNTRYSGEYLKLNNELYRIVTISNGLTKVIKENSFGISVWFDDESVDYSFSNVYSYLKDMWYKSDLGGEQKLVFENGSWCYRKITGGEDYSTTCHSETITSPVGLPSLGDLYTCNNNGNDSTFWTIDPFSDFGTLYMNVVTKTGRDKVLITDRVDVKPVMYLKDNVIITSGNGSYSNPYTLDLK